MTANEITAALLIAIPRRFRGYRVKRQNVGLAYSYHLVKSAIDHLLHARWKEALECLRQRPIRFGVPGEPDIEGIMPPGGRCLCIEVKAGKDRQSPQQKKFQRTIETAGGVYIIARDVETTLREIEERMR